MNKKNIFFGTLVLAFAGFFASKANTKFSAAKAYYITALGGCAAIDNSTAVAGTDFTTTGTCQARVKTSNGGFVYLYAVITCTVPVYVVPN